MGVVFREIFSLFTPRVKSIISMSIIMIANYTHEYTPQLGSTARSHNPSSVERSVFRYFLLVEYLFWVVVLHLHMAQLLPPRLRDSQAHLRPSLIMLSCLKFNFNITSEDNLGFWDQNVKVHPDLKSMLNIYLFFK